MEKIAVERSVWINAPRERAWQAVTEAEHLDRWYATSYRWDIPALNVGATVRFYGKDEVTASDEQVATIAVVDPPNEFTLRWQPNPEYPAVSLLTRFLLAEENGGTRVTISESGYENVPEDERAAWLAATGGGYSLSVENLKALLENRALPY